MRRAACKDWAEASCLISNLLAELEQPCRMCREDSLVLTGRSPTDGTVNNNNVYNANFAPRPALMELPCTSSPCGESRGPSSKEAISRRPWA